MALVYEYQKYSKYSWKAKYKITVVFQVYTWSELKCAFDIQCFLIWYFYFLCGCVRVRVYI